MKALKTHGEHVELSVSSLTRNSHELKPCSAIEPRKPFPEHEIALNELLFYLSVPRKFSRFTKRRGDPLNSLRTFLLRAALWSPGRPGEVKRVDEALVAHLVVRHGASALGRRGWFWRISVPHSMTRPLVMTRPFWDELERTLQGFGATVRRPSKEGN